MIFAKHPEEEVTVVSGVRYTDTVDYNPTNRNNSSGSYGTGGSNTGESGSGGGGQTPSRAPRSVDVEMGRIRSSRSRGQEEGEEEDSSAFGAQGEGATLV